MPPTPRFITAIQGPPGPLIRRPTPAEPHPPDNPRIFTDAMTVRDKVFVDEQRCAADMELDEDDARSWHWVMYDTASTSGTDTSGSTTATMRDGEGRTPIPIGVIRLVPPPHAAHEHLHPTIEDGVDTAAARARHDQPYVKVTRVALLKEYRGQGLSRELVEIALSWAARHPEQIDQAVTAAAAGSPTGMPNAHWEGLVLVHAQTTVEGLYERLGFETDKGLGKWTEERMEHVGMWKTVTVQRGDLR